MKFKYLLLFLILLMPLSNAYDYEKVTGDSIFASGVDFEKISDNSYYAFVTADLNYNGYLNPKDRYQVAEQYNWDNYWQDYLNLGYALETKYYNDGGVVKEFLSPYYYLELLGENEDPFQISDIGYYGLPFYIHTLEFYCDINSKSKGYLFLESGSSIVDYNTGDELFSTDIVSLIRPDYVGFSNPDYTLFEGLPVAFGTYPGEIVRYNNIPVKCEGINTGNAQLNIVFKPNLMYRFVDPSIEDSHIWNYEDIISILPDVSNDNYVEFSINIEYNLSLDNSWTYNITNTEFDDFTDSAFNPDVIRNLNCIVETRFKSYETTYNELTQSQRVNMNSGWVDNEIISCSYPPTPNVVNINGKSGNDILTALSLQQQQENLFKLEQLDQKFELKRFVVNSVLPILFYLVVIVFYSLELILLGVLFIGFLPTMFNWFIEGMKEAFNVDDLIQYKRGRRWV